MKLDYEGGHVAKQQQGTNHVTGTDYGCCYGCCLRVPTQYLKKFLFLISALYFKLALELDEHQLLIFALVCLKKLFLSVIF
jgi:hypothetical protein